jgi:hypothetical protein
VKAPRSPGELLLETYLASRGLDLEYETPHGNANPDFTVALPAGPVVMEVYEPEFRLPTEAGSIDSYSVVRTAVKRKARQGKGVRDRGLPYVLVLGRTNSDLPFGDHNVPGALFGNITITIPLELDEPADVPAESRVGFGSGGRLQAGINRRFSAVAVVREFNPTQRHPERLWRERLGAEDPGDLAMLSTVVSEAYRESEEAGLYDIRRGLQAATPRDA